MSAHVFIEVIKLVANKKIKCSAGIKITLKSHSAVKTLYFCHYVRNVVMDVITFPVNLLTTSGLSILLHGVISLPDAVCFFYVK